MSFRGRTFSPAEDWQAGGTKFALAKLGEVRDYLMELCAEELARDDDRRWWQRRRVRWQRVYDLEDAARTVSDAVARLRVQEDGLRLLANYFDGCATEAYRGSRHPAPETIEEGQAEGEGAAFTAAEEAVKGLLGAFAEGGVVPAGSGLAQIHNDSVVPPPDPGPGEPPSLEPPA